MSNEDGSGITMRPLNDAPPWLQVDPSWKCAGTPVVPPPSATDATTLLGTICEVILLHPLPNPVSSDYDLAQELALLESGGTVMNVFAGLATSAEFTQLIWSVAVGKAFDYCVDLLKLSEVPEILALRQGYIENFFLAYQASSAAVKGDLDFGWIVASILSTQQWADLGRNCNLLPEDQIQLG